MSPPYFSVAKIGPMSRASLCRSWAGRDYSGAYHGNRQDREPAYMLIPAQQAYRRRPSPGEADENLTGK